MTVPALEVLEPGLLTTVQDKGRYGYQRSGVPVSGALDVFALRVANILAGNDDGDAALEVTVIGPVVRFLSDTWIAIAGADLSAELDGSPIPTWEGVNVSTGSVLRFHGARDGMRSYLAVAGGIDVPIVMGSSSTYLTGSFGGFEGRALRAGDILQTKGSEPRAKFAKRVLPDHLEAPTYGHAHRIRVVLGPQQDAFTPGGVAVFLNSRYSVSLESDRTGYRLEGPTIEHKSGPDIVSDGSPLGAVQVPGDGLPIILLADRGTTGGYAKIATVIGPDIGTLAQAMPGDTLTFQSVTVEEAHAILRQEADVLEAVRSDPVKSEVKATQSIVVDGHAFEVAYESGDPIAGGDVDGEPATTESHRIRGTVGGKSYEFDVEVRRRSGNPTR